ncbi:MAG: hypothetical protein KDL10_11275, partial [Kiritimatiellae bacterium]|nr:hypothetical protein [Kiritimatiellia bacterium]
YQVTSREYMEFLRDEINGTNNLTLSGTGAGGDPPYLARTDTWFDALRAWGDTIWNLWLHNKDLPGAAPIEMAAMSAPADLLPPDVTLTVASSHGSPQPAGVTTSAWGSVVTASVDAVVSGGTAQFTCLGWTLAGNDPVSGVGTQAVITLTNHAELTWAWSTSYWFEAVGADHGTLTVSSHWAAAGSSLSVTAAPDLYYHFDHWTGDVAPGSETSHPLTVVMAAPMTLSAVFAENLTTLDTPEGWPAFHYPGTNDFEDAAMSDTDLDGIRAWAEYICGTDPTNRYSVLTLDTSDPRLGVLVWPSVSGRFYTILYTTNPVGEGFLGLPGASNLPASPAWNSYTNPQSFEDAPALFYMLKVRNGP